MRRAIQRLAVLSLLGMVATGLTACDDLLTESPPNILVPDNLYTSPAGFEAGLNALYDQARQEFSGLSDGGFNNHRNVYWTAGTDNAFGGWKNDNPSNMVNEWGIRNQPTTSQTADIWAWLYRTINAANTIIGRAADPKIAFASPAERNRVIAEARFFRAWAYRHLSYLYGSVPITREEITAFRTDFERAPLADVLKQIEDDLVFAEANLPAISGSGARVSKPLAQHFLAEHYLRTSNPARAETMAEAVINSGQFRLITARYGVRANQPGVAFMDQFYDGNVLRNQGNTEALWVAEFQQNVPGGGINFMRRLWATQYFGIGGVDLSVEHGGRGQQRANPTKWAWTIYEPQDERFSGHAVRRFYIFNTTRGLPSGRKLGDTLWLTVRDDVVEDRNRMTTRKWDWADPAALAAGESWQDIAYVRLAETYLLAAEAEFRQGKLAEAADRINALRARAKATPIGPAQVTLDFILEERSRELLTEEHRRYTLMRTGTYLDRVKRFNPIAAPNITPRDTLFPIPQQVIESNRSKPLVQNPGY